MSPYIYNRSKGDIPGAQKIELMKTYVITQRTPKYENCRIGMKADDNKDAIRKAPLVVTGFIKSIEEVDEMGEYVSFVWKRKEA